MAADAADYLLDECQLNDEDETQDDGWENLMGGKIRKRVLVPGYGTNPEMNQDVLCNISVCLAADPGQVLQKWTQKRFRVGEGEAVPMVELSLRYMKEGEEAEVIGVATMAWGSLGLKAGSPDELDVPPDSDLLMRIKLLSNLHPELDGDGNPTWAERGRQAAWRKASGNDYFHRQKFELATRCYLSGVKAYDGSFEPPEDIVIDRDSARAEAAKLCADCSANVAAVYLETGALTNARDAAKAALEADPEHAKALYRLARAHLLLRDFDECEEALRRAAKCYPADAAIKRLMLDLRKERQEYSVKRKAMAAKFFQASNAEATSGAVCGALNTTMEVEERADASFKAGWARTEEELDTELECLLYTPSIKRWSAPWWRSLPWMHVALSFVIMACAIVVRLDDSNDAISVDSAEFE